MGQRKPFVRRAIILPLLLFLFLPTSSFKDAFSAINKDGGLDSSRGAPDLFAAAAEDLISIRRSEPTVPVLIKSNVLLIFRPSKNIDLSICLALITLILSRP